MALGSPHRRLLAALVAAVVAVVAAIALYLSGDDGGRSHRAGTSTPSPSQSSSSSTSAVGAGPASSSPAASLQRPVLTKDGLWWGVDSYVPITAESLNNAKHWYVGRHTPQFWGRYLSGEAGIRDGELAFARAHGIYVYLIVNDRNCSACNGGDACGNDRTAAQARSDASAAVRSARRLHVPPEAVLFKDIEEVSSCRGEPTVDYLVTWRATTLGSGFRTGFYGNATRQSYEFPTAYCKAVAKDPVFRTGVPLVMNEPEPQLGAPRRTIGPANAPRFRPSYPHCVPLTSVVIWQYGESVDDANVTDVDQARTDIRGLLAPDGTVT